MIALDVERGDDAEMIERSIRGALRSGVQGLWIRSAPWGDHQAEQSLASVLAHPDLSHLPVISLRPVEAELWMAMDVGWVADCSALTSEPIGLGALRQRLITMSYRPRMGEVVIVRPHVSCVKPAVLDAIFEDIAPGGRGWIYTDADPIEVMPAVLGAATPWSVRRAPCPRPSESTDEASGD